MKTGLGNAAAGLLACAIVAADQATKLLVVTHMQLGERISVLPGFLTLTSVRNRGGAFGLLSDLPDPWGRVFFTVFALATMAVLGWMLWRLPREERLQRVALAAVIGGAAGNLWDRLRHGEVIDFLDAHVGGWHWPAFNVADSFITIGVGLLLLSALRIHREAE